MRPVIFQLALGQAVTMGCDLEFASFRRHVPKLDAGGVCESLGAQQDPLVQFELRE